MTDRRITNETDARVVIAGSDTLLLPVPSGVLANLGAADLRTLARRAGLSAHFASMGDKALLCSILSGETVADDWSLSSAGSWVRVMSGTAPAPAPAPAPASTDLLGALGATLTQAARDAAQARIDEIVADQGFTRPIVIQQLDGTSIEVSGDEHPALLELVRLDACIAPHDKNYLLIGPAGTGKSTIARDFARKLSVDFGEISCTAGMSEGALLGRVRPFATPGSAEEYSVSGFVERYSEGGVFLLDELDASDPNTTVVLNASLSGGRVTVPMANRQFGRAPACRIIGAMNTEGTGGDRQYTGREALDAALLNRFCGRVIYVDYDRGLDRRIMDAHIDDGTLANSALERIWGARDKIKETDMRRIMGTREVSICAQKLRGGYSLDECMLGFIGRWTREERAKIGEGVS